MNPLIAKEIRLLLPAYGMALLLAIVPAWLLPTFIHTYGSDVITFTLYLFGFGTVMLALSSFGREFGLNTFPLLLAQPLARTRLWWTKIAVLAGALATVFGALCLTHAARIYVVVNNGPDWLEVMIVGATTALVAFAGALWSTLLLRQVIAAFWFTILIPGAILMIISLTGGKEVAMLVAMGVYSAAGFWLASWLFSRVQEAGWTGGVISFPNWKTAGAAARPSLRNRRALAALFGRELQLHQVSLLGMGGLFVLHLGVVWLRKASHLAVGDTMRTALEVFGGLWFIVPVLTGCLSVSEERKLGTMQGLLCLPVSSRIQFFIKLFLTLIVGGLLSAVLLWTAEGVGSLIGAGEGLGGSKTPFDREALYALSLVFLVLSLIGFYASTLTRGIVQALAAAVGMIIVVWLFIMIMVNQAGIGVHLWHGNLVNYIAWPTLIPAVIWLAWRNFRSESADWLLWRRNLLGVAGVLVFIMVTTTAIYNRAWELLTPLEPAHGPALLTWPKPAQLRDYYGGGHIDIVALLPDGRLWVDHLDFNLGHFILTFKREKPKAVGDNEETTGFRVGSGWTSHGDRFAAGSNWVDAVTKLGQTIGVRDDGTLWVSPKPQALGKGQSRLEQGADLVRFENGTDWQSVVPENSFAVLLLKRDGTLWRLGVNDFIGRTNWSGFNAFKPIRLGTSSDWTRILLGRDGIYAWKKDGSAWVIHPPEKDFPNPELVLQPGELVAERIPVLDNTKWRKFAGFMNRPVGLREDGTLWALNSPRQRQGTKKARPYQTTITQIGKDTDWVGVSGQYRTLAALKADGSIWEWSFREEDWYYSQESWSKFLPDTKSPVRLGTHTDWVAIGNSMGGTVSLAADGSLYYWWDRGWVDITDQPMLAPSRKPSKIENILAREK